MITAPYLFRYDGACQQMGAACVSPVLLVDAGAGTVSGGLGSLEATVAIDPVDQAALTDLLNAADFWNLEVPSASGCLDTGSLGYYGMIGLKQEERDHSLHYDPFCALPSELRALQEESQALYWKYFSDQ